MSRITPATAESSPELRAVYDEIAQSRGWVSNAMASFSNAPEGLRRLALLGDYGRYGTDLTELQRELAILTIGRGVSYAAAHHATLAIQAGVPEPAVQAILAGRVPEQLAAPERALVRYVLEFGAPDSVSDSTYAELSRHFSVRSITDLTLLAAYYLALGTSLNAFKVQLETPEERDVEVRWQKAKMEAA